MKNLVLTFEGKYGLLDVAHQLESWRNELRFRDHVWEQQLTQQIVTFDSASTLIPKTDRDNIQHQTAIKGAITKLIELIDEKLGESN